jgi:tRNA (guanine-N7-)-methyltransferase
VTPRLLADVHRALIPGGLFVVQTDNPDYWSYMTGVLPSFFEFRVHPQPWPDAPDGRTRREILARQRGLTIFRGEATRRDHLSPEAAAALVRSLPLPTFRSLGPWSELDRWESRMHED